MDEQTKIDRLQAVSLITHVYLGEADVSIELQGDTYIISADDVEGDADVTLTTKALQQLSAIELGWLQQTCRELIAARD